MRTASILAWLLLPGLLWAAPAAPEKDDKTENAVEKLRSDLDRRITIKIEKQPLSAAIDMLREKAKLNIFLDAATIQQQLGFPPDQANLPVQLDLKDMKARAALRAILQPYNLSCAVIGDTILVTTDDMAIYRQMHQRVSLDLDGVELGTALKQISRDTAANLILDPRADKGAAVKVRLQAEDMPLETAVRLLAEMAGLKPVRAGNTLFVTRKEIANELRNDPDLAPPQSQPGVGITYAVPFNAVGGPVQFINTVAVPAQPAPQAPLPPGGSAPTPPAAPPAPNGPMGGTGGAPAAPAARWGRPTSPSRKRRRRRNEKGKQDWLALNPGEAAKPDGPHACRVGDFRLFGDLELMERVRPAAERINFGPYRGVGGPANRPNWPVP